MVSDQCNRNKNYQQFVYGSDIAIASSYGIGKGYQEKRLGQYNNNKTFDSIFITNFPPVAKYNESC